MLYRGKGTCAASAQVFSASSTALKFTVNGPCASERPSPSAPCQACFPGVPIRLSVVCDSSWLLLALPKEADPPPSSLAIYWTWDWSDVASECSAVQSLGKCHSILRLLTGQGGKLREPFGPFNPVTLRAVIPSPALLFYTSPMAQC